MRHRWIMSAAATLLAVVLPLAASGQDAPEYLCTQGELQRRLIIFYETGVAVPCEVHYFKDTEAPGEREVLWRALSESGYCESQARDFVATLEGWGWTCAAALPSDIIDDTEALAPATRPPA